MSLCQGRSGSDKNRDDAGDADTAQGPPKATPFQVHLCSHSQRLPSGLYYEPCLRDKESGLGRGSHLLMVTGFRREPGLCSEAVGL